MKDRKETELMTPIREDAKNWQLSDVHKVYFKFTGNPCIAGQSYITNTVGHFFLYMGDDHRADPSEGIIATMMGGGDLVFLDMKAKQEIEIKTRNEIRRGGIDDKGGEAGSNPASSS